MYHCTAMGKAFLAGWDTSMRQAIFNSCELVQMTANTITDLDTLEAQLAEFRAQGYATDHEEFEIGVNGIGSWVIDGLGEIAAAISVSGHASRLTDEVIRRIAPDVIQAADAISEAMGGDGSRRCLPVTGQQ
jgi:DNA-binding IclR family transcriptional regulator